MRICPHVKFDAKTSRDTARRPVFQKTQRDAKTRSPALTPVINETPAGHKPDQSTQYHLYCTFPLIKSQGNFLIFVYGGGTEVRRTQTKIRAAQTGSAEIMVYAYRLDAANRQIGICRAGGAAALAPRTCEGGVPALAQGRGEYEFPEAKRKKYYLSVFAVLIPRSFFVKEMWVTDSPRHQFANWWHPPHKCGGQGRVPHPPAHHATNSSTNSQFVDLLF